MKNIYQFLLGMAVCYMQTSAQVPGQKIYYNRDPRLGSGADAIAASSNGFAVMGTGALPSGSYPYLMSVDQSFQVNFTRQYLNPDYQVHIDGVEADTDIFNTLFPEHLLAVNHGKGGYLLTGEIDTSATITYANGVIVGGNVIQRAFLLKTSAAGRIEWSFKYGGREGVSLNFARSLIIGNSIYTFGSAQQVTSVSHDLCVAKLDMNGKVIWIRQIGGSGDDSFGDVVYDQNGSFLVCGGSESFSTIRNVYALKIDTSGNIIWSKTYSVGPFDYGFSIEKISGNYMILAYMVETNTALMLFKIDAKGNLILAKSLGSSTLDGVLQVRKSGSKHVAVTGYSFDGFQNDILLFKCDTLGNAIWSKQIGDNRVYNSNGNPTAIDEVPSDMLVQDKNYLVVGKRDSTFESGVGPQFHYSKSYLADADKNGNAVCNERDYPNFNNSYDLTVTTVSSSNSPANIFTVPYKFFPQNSNYISRDLCAPGQRNTQSRDKEFLIYPNPASSVLSVQSTNDNADLSEAFLINSLGETVLYRDFSNGGNLDVSKLPAGIYTLFIKNANGIFSEKVLLQR